MSERATRFRSLEGPHRRGDATEAILRAAFAVRGVTVSRPDHDNDPYDFVVDVGGRFHRIQAKTAYETRNEGSVCFEPRSTRVKSDGYEREGYRGAADYFAVYAPATDAAYLVAVDEVGSSSMAIRYEPPANGDWSGVNWHEDYAIDAVLPEL